MWRGNEIIVARVIDGLILNSSIGLTNPSEMLKSSATLREKNPHSLLPQTSTGSPSPAKDVANLCWRQFFLLFLPFLFILLNNTLFFTTSPLSFDRSVGTQVTPICGSFAREGRVEQSWQKSKLFQQKLRQHRYPSTSLLHFFYDTDGFVASWVEGENRSFCKLSWQRPCLPSCHIYKMGLSQRRSTSVDCTIE